MSAVMRRTKIIATLGRSTDVPGVLEAMMRNGVNLVRLNFSHGTADDQARRIKAVRQCSQQLGLEIGVMADLQGPKIRIAKFKDGSVILQSNDRFILDASWDKNAGTQERVGIDYKQLPQDVKAGDTLLLDDGRLVFSVLSVHGDVIECQVVIGGELSNNKGINRMGGGLSAQALTAKDKVDLKTAVALGVDYIAISFPRSAADVLDTKDLIIQAGGQAGVIAKIERTEAVAAINEIIEAADAVMVARGDLGVEIGDAELPSIQKLIIRQCRAMNKAVITATQMMETMIHNAIPTRAEVFDVANAVLDGTDAVMLSAETAIGDDPARVIAAMSRICVGAERNRVATKSGHRMGSSFTRIDEAIAMAAMYVANHMNISAIICLTESGSTPLWMSRIRSGIPIFGLSRHAESRYKMTLYRGVYPLAFDVTQLRPDAINVQAIALLEQRGLVKQGDYVLLTHGDYMGIHGGTNTMKLQQVGKMS
jgi:pyruvate kinase